MGAFAEKDILELSVSERIQLAQDIWDSIAQVPESITLGDEEKAGNRTPASGGLSQRP